MKFILNGKLEAFRNAIREEKKLRKKIEKDIINQIDKAIRQCQGQKAALVIIGKHEKRTYAGKILPTARKLIIYSLYNAQRINEGTNYEIPTRNAIQILPGRHSKPISANQKLYLHYQRREHREASFTWTIDDFLPQRITGKDPPVRIRLYIGDEEFHEKFLRHMGYGKEKIEGILKLLV